MTIQVSRFGRGVSPFIILLLFLQSLPVLGASKKCFNGSGDQTDQLPCSPDSNAEGICCDAGDICLSNDLCKLGPNAERKASINVDTYRPGCTDQNWDTENCFSGCNDYPVQQPLVQSCYDNRYCCYGSKGCICSDTSLFELDAATFVTTLPAGTAQTTPASNVATTTSRSAVSSTATTSPTPSSIDEPSSSSSSNSHLGVAVGAGVGAGLGVIMIAALVAFLYLRRRRRQQSAIELSSDGVMGHDKKRHATPLLEADGHSAPQEIGHQRDPAYELDGGERMKIRLT